MQRKRVFDFVRTLLGRGFRQSEVDALDRILDAANEVSQGDAATVAPRSVGDAGVRLIKRFEGCARLQPDGTVKAYPDPGTGGVPWTIGWGATGPDIGPATIWTQEQCDARLVQDIARHAHDVAETLGNAPTTQNQFDALVSFHFNTGAIGRSTLAKRHVAGDFTGAAAEFLRWNRAGGRVMKGLVRRRREEATLYRSNS